MTRFLSRPPSSVSSLPTWAGTSAPAFLFATDPERDPFGRRARAMRGAPALRRRSEAEGGRYRASRTDWKESRMQHEPSRRRHRRRARRPRRSRLPALPAARPQAGPLLDRGRSGRRPRAVALRPPPRTAYRGSGPTPRPAGARPIRHRNAPTLRAALDEARAFLCPCRFHRRRARATLLNRGAAVPHDAGTHAEAYLLARGLSRCRFAAL